MASFHEIGMGRNITEDKRNIWEFESIWE